MSIPAKNKRRLTKITPGGRAVVRSKGKRSTNRSKTRAIILVEGGTTVRKHKGKR